jgi:eukaryotic-like serine/threonine-protein kinase
MLSAGSRLGAGGMGDVYRARDTRLDRAVAVKVLPDSLASDAAFRQRLHTEARAISQLSHPHICTLHDIGEQDGTTFLVMELIEGETLAERLARQADGGLALEEALRLGTQIAEALAAAHRRGIIHRDLKPGNVMLTKTGAARAGASDVKLLDFGLAKVVQPAVATRDASRMPTTPPQAVTAAGSVLGTFQYMAPEQIEGAEADARSDIFAFGCVLYEMVTGKPAFEGKSHAGIMAAILEREPVPITSLESRVSPLVVAIVRRCLAKSPDDRWQTATDLAGALRWATDGLGVTGALGENAAQRITPRSWARRALLPAAIAMLAFAAGAALAWRSLSATNTPPAATRFEVPPPPDTRWSPSPAASTAQLALSPDGRRLAFVAAPRRGASQIWIRPLDSVHAQPLAGTDGASFPFWSADGRFVGFFAGGKLKKIDTTGGTPQVLADAPLGRGGSWNLDGVVIFTPAPNSGIWRVPAEGGVSAPVTAPSIKEGQAVHNWPLYLPDGRRFIYYQRSDKPEHQGVYVRTLDSNEATLVIQSNGLAVAVPGYLFFLRDGMLFAQAVDDRTLKIAAQPVRVADQVGYFGASLGYMAVSAAGSTLAYGPSVPLTTGLQWRDRTGPAVGPVIARGIFRFPRLSPDEQRIAMTVTDERAAAADIWVLVARADCQFSTTVSVGCFG